MCQYHRKLPVYVSNFFWCVCFEPSSVFLLCTTFLFFLLLGWQNQVGKEALSITEVLESAKGALLMESSRKPGCGLVVHDRQLGRWSLHGPRSPQQAAASTQVKLVVRHPAAAKPAESAPFCRWSGSRAGASAEKARVRWPPRLGEVCREGRVNGPSKLRSTRSISSSPSWFSSSSPASRERVLPLGTSVGEAAPQLLPLLPDSAELHGTCLPAVENHILH